jgi:hypothetical protein
MWDQKPHRVGGCSWPGSVTAHTVLGGELISTIISSYLGVSLLGVRLTPDQVSFSKIASVLNTEQAFFLSLFPRQCSITTICLVFLMPNCIRRYKSGRG